MAAATGELIGTGTSLAAGSRRVMWRIGCSQCLLRRSVRGPSLQYWHQAVLRKAGRRVL
jgi:hypothetical protein